MSEQDNIQVAQKWIEALNAHDVSQFDKYRGPGYLFDVPDFPGPVGVDEEITFTQAIFEAFPDMRFDAKQTIAQGDFVVMNGVMAGTHDGPLAMPNGQTVPATGKKATVPLSDTFEVANGKIVRNSLYYDNLGMMVQLGLMPGM